jgi:hypothetical protein
VTGKNPYRVAIANDVTCYKFDCSNNQWRNIDKVECTCMFKGSDPIIFSIR